MNTLKIESKDKEGNPIEVYVKRPTSDQMTKAQNHSNKVFREAIDSKAVLRIKLDDYMESQGLWGEEQKKKLDEIDKRIESNVKKLINGKQGKFSKLSQAKKLALDIKKDRFERFMLLAKRRELDEYTVESQAENAKFDFLVTLCVYNEDGENVFKDLTDYQEKRSEPYAIMAASKLATLIHEYDEEWEKKLPENLFLLKHNLVDEKLRLINADKHLVTEDGKLINEEGQYVDSEGNRVNRDGQRIDENGNVIVKDFVEFDNDI